MIIKNQNYIICISANHITLINTYTQSCQMHLGYGFGIQWHFQLYAYSFSVDDLSCTVIFVHVAFLINSIVSSHKAVVITFLCNIVTTLISDSKLYSGVELRPWTFQWDLTLYLLIWIVSHINRSVHQCHIFGMGGIPILGVTR